MKTKNKDRWLELMVTIAGFATGLVIVTSVIMVVEKIVEIIL